MKLRLIVLAAFVPAFCAFGELTESEQNRLASALGVIEAKLGTNYAAHSNFGILLGDAAAKERVLGDGSRIAQTIPIYERVARALTNVMAQAASTNTGTGRVTVDLQ